eukprot:scaffold3335_cov113-Isochrysis_galbana.AAC.2
MRPVGGAAVLGVARHGRSPALSNSTACRPAGACVCRLLLGSVPAGNLGRCIGIRRCMHRHGRGAVASDVRLRGGVDRLGGVARACVRRLAVVRRARVRVYWLGAVEARIRYVRTAVAVAVAVQVTLAPPSSLLVYGAAIIGARAVRRGRYARSPNRQHGQRNRNSRHLSSGPGFLPRQDGPERPLKIGATSAGVCRGRAIGG